MIVAVDGPSGAGKSSVCRIVAQRRGMMLLDTGAIYRCVALSALRYGLALDDEAKVGARARAIEVRFEAHPEGQRVYLDGEDVSEAIRTPAASQGASKVAALPQVRDALLALQRQLGRSTDSVVEGRDIGTVVFPDAELKVYYTASTEARAKRRMAQLAEGGTELSYEQVVAEIEARDERDRGRAVAPLRQAEDAVVLDTSALDFEQSCAALEALIEEARG